MLSSFLLLAGEELNAPAALIGARRHGGPGISPSSRVQFSTLARSTTGAFGSSSAAIVEGTDAVAASGSTATLATGAIVEGLDLPLIAGATATSATASIVETTDTVIADGTATGITIGAAAIFESGDIVVASGATAVNARAALVEQRDAFAAFGQTATAAFGAIVEGLDASAASGYGFSTGSANILESFDAVSAAARVQPQSYADIVEGMDAVASAAGVGVIGAMAVVESGDAIAMQGLLIPPSQFGWAVVVPSSQAGAFVGGGVIQGAQPAYPENTTCVVQASWFNLQGQLFVPLAVSYRVDDVESGINLVPWTTIVPGLQNLVIITGVQNAMVSMSRESEEHQILFSITDSYNNVSYARALFDILQVQGAPVPDFVQGSAAIFEGADIMAGGS